MEEKYSSESQNGRKTPEERYSYYRRCQVFRRNGVQCKAPAEKGSYICHAHAGQLATAVRRERERRAILAEAVAEMRQRGKPECEPVDLFMDFKGIQVTLAKMAQALIDGRIDCKTAGRLVVQLQMASKLLWMAQKAKARIEAKTRREEKQVGVTRRTHVVVEEYKECGENSLMRHGDPKYSRDPSAPPQSLRFFVVGQDDKVLGRGSRYGLWISNRAGPCGPMDFLKAA